MGEGVSGTLPISELCRHHGIAATQCYDWQKRFLAAYGPLPIDALHIEPARPRLILTLRQ